jgi:hypothetical protein
VEVAGKTSLWVTTTLDLVGARASSLRASWERWLTRRLARPPNRRWDMEEYEARFVGRAIQRTPQKGTVVPDPNRTDALRLTARYAEAGAFSLGSTLSTMEVPVEVHHQLLDLVPVRRRKTPMQLELADEAWELTFSAPKGFQLAGVPVSEAHGEGPVQVSVVWTAFGRGAKLEYRLLVSEPIIDPAHAAGVHEVARIVQQLARTRLVFVRVN